MKNGISTNINQETCRTIDYRTSTGIPSVPAKHVKRRLRQQKAERSHGKDSPLDSPFQAVRLEKTSKDRECQMTNMGPILLSAEPTRRFPGRTFRTF